MPVAACRSACSRAVRQLPMLAVALMLASLMADGSASAQTADPLDAAFAAMMRQPGDADATLAYAREAAARGQTRAAIAALERLLRINPRLDNIRLELRLAASGGRIAGGRRRLCA
ncbi:hypothetical protein [Dankookia sp. P2]|uniref:hypothetical protein n=1 Tax=Dankookia sp. P2 TaxID=3423955 RepID=UPI003D675132